VFPIDKYNNFDVEISFSN